MARKGVTHYLRIIVLVLLATMAGIFFFFPLFWTISTSLKNDADSTAYPPKFIFTPEFKKYAIAFNILAPYIANSLITAVGGTLLALVVGLLAAYAIARFEVANKELTMFMTLMVRMLPPIAVASAFVIMMRTLGLYDTQLGLILIYGLINLPIVLWVMRGFFEEFPPEIEDAAKLDGLSQFNVLLRITLPCMGPGLLTVSLLSFLFSWNDLFFAIILTSAQAKTGTISMYSFLSTTKILWNQLCAAGIIFTLPTIIFYFLVRRYLTRGLTFGVVR